MQFYINIVFLVALYVNHLYFCVLSDFLLAIIMRISPFWSKFIFSFSNVIVWLISQHSRISNFEAIHVAFILPTTKFKHFRVVSVMLWLVALILGNSSIWIIIILVVLKISISSHLFDSLRFSFLKINAWEKYAYKKT